MSPGAAAIVVKTVVRPVTVVAAAALATAAVAAAVEIAADSVETAADSAEAAAVSVEVAAVSAPPVGKCSTQSAPSVARKRKFPSSPAVLAPYIVVIASRPTARHVVAAAVVAVDSATAVVAAIAVPAATNR